MEHKRITALLTALAAFAASVPQSALAADGINPETGLPYSFDLREQGLVSAVKNQSPYGTCWAHGAMGSLESRLIADDPAVDLSEWHLALFTRMGESGLSDESDMEQILDYGGLPEEISAMLLNRVGPMREADYPYGSGTPDRSVPIRQMQQQAAIEVTDTHSYRAWDGETFLPEPEEIKRLLCSGTAPSVTVSQCVFQSSCFSPQYCSVYLPPEMTEQIRAEYPEKFAISPHAMTLVGWDDNFPREHFTYPPDRDGAWLIKNSWGPEWSDSGYIWISYADRTVGAFEWYDVRPAADHDQLFSHDNCGESGRLSLSAGYQDTEAYYANVFVPDADCCLTDLLLCCTDPADTLTVTVYTGLKDRSDPTSGTPAPAEVYQGLHTGYQEVPLSFSVSVKAGEPFSVTVKASGSAGAHIPCELSMEDDTLVKKSRDYLYGSFTGAGIASSQLRKYFAENESFISADGREWTDTADITKITNESSYSLILGNVCVRAYGVNAGRVIFSDEHTELAAGQELALSNAEGADIYYAIDGGSYQRYEKPFPFTGDMTVSAYADTGSKAVQTRRLTQRHAVLSSLLMRGQNGSQYADLTKYSFHLNSAADSFLQPISTGTITVNGKKLVSGHKYLLQPEDADTGILLRVEQEGMLPTEYSITVTDINRRPIPDGIYYDAPSKTAWEIRGGSGTEKSLSDGGERSFTCALLEPFIWKFTYSDGETVSYYREMFFSEDRGYLTGRIRLTGEYQTRQFEYLNPLTFAAYPAYSDAQVEEYVLAAFKAYTGKAADRVDTEETAEGVIVLNFMGGSQLLDTLFADHFGLMFTSDMKPFYYSLPQYRRCDLNGDKALTIADAVMMLRLIAEDAPGQAPSENALRAADLNCDGVLNVIDTALLLDMLNRKTNDRA